MISKTLSVKMLLFHILFCRALSIFSLIFNIKPDLVREYIPCIIRCVELCAFICQRWKRIKSDKSLKLKEHMTCHATYYGRISPKIRVYGANYILMLLIFYLHAHCIYMYIVHCTVYTIIHMDTRICKSVERRRVCLHH